MTDKGTFYLVLCRTAYRYCELVAIVNFGFYLGIYAMRLVNSNNAYRQKLEICLNCAYEQRFTILKVRRNVISTVI